MTSTPANRALLANLRPGAPVADVAAAYGSRWKPPLPHREGRVLTIDMSDGVVAAITKDGKLGSIRFNWRFGEDVPVLGVHMSARADELKARFPALDLSPMSAGPFSYPKLVDGALHLKFELGTTYEGERYLRSIEIYDPAAAYPQKQPVAYPPPSGERGAPFKDENLKLAVLSELIDGGHIDLGDPQDLYDHVLGRRFDLEKEGYDAIQQARDYLVRYPLPQQLLGEVASIEFDGGAQIYRYISYFWGGETDEFDVRSFDGIEALKNLKQIRIISMVEDSEANMARLRALGIDVR